METWEIIALILLATVAGVVLLAVTAWIMWKRATREERRLIKRVGDLGFGSKLALAGRMIRDGRMPLAVRLALPVLVVYLALPVDFIPDFIPVIGWLDDVFVLVVGLHLVLRAVPRSLIDEHIAALERAELDRTAIEAEQPRRDSREAIEAPRERS